MALLLLTAFGPFDPNWVATAVLMAALPPALNVFVLARQYNAWVEPASGSVLLGTLLSVATLTTVMWLVQQGGLPHSLHSLTAGRHAAARRHSGARFHHAAAGAARHADAGGGGRQVIKIERPGGEDMRRYEPRFDGESAMFALLNRGKKSLVLDLKDKSDRAQLMPLVKRADVLVEQFRPGVMARLGLGYEALRKINPRLIYCSITGYGQTGPRAARGGPRHQLHRQHRAAGAATRVRSTGRRCRRR